MRAYRYDEADPKTATTGPFQKSALNLNKMSAAKFLAHWDLPKQVAPHAPKLAPDRSTDPNSLPIGIYPGRWPFQPLTLHPHPPAPQPKPSLTVPPKPDLLAHWPLPKQAVAMVVRGMALFEGPPKRLKSKGSALDLVRRLKRYKESYKTFPHMTSPYVRPVGGFSERLTSATANVLEAADGCSVEETGPIELLYEDSACVGVACGGVQVHADCVVASPECVPDHVAPAYHIVRLYAVLAHPPNLCKDSSSCQLLIPAEHCGRSHDIYMSSYSHTHGVAPKGKWVVTASTRIDGSADGADALVIAKRELAAVLPLLKPSRKLLAEVVPYNEPLERVPDRLLVLSARLPARLPVASPRSRLDLTHPARAPKSSSVPARGQISMWRDSERPSSSGAEVGLLVRVPGSCDETSYFDSVQDDVTSVFERITGEPLAAAGARRAF